MTVFEKKKTFKTFKDFLNFNQQHTIQTTCFLLIKESALLIVIKIYKKKKFSEIYKTPHLKWIQKIY